MFSHAKKSLGDGRRVLLILNPAAGIAKPKAALYGVIESYAKYGCATTVMTTAGKGDAMRFVAENAKAYDLERQVELDNLSGFSSDDLAEGYFEADAYSDELKNSLNRYEELCFRKDLTEDERAERAEIRIRFKNISSELSGAAKERFEDIERRRKAHD